MTERIAVVGNRKGADLRQVEDFLLALWAQQPDSIIISGDAEGVDQKAESIWFNLGGRVISYRPAAFDSLYGVEIWHYGGGEGRTCYVLPIQEQRVKLADFRSAALYRDMLIAENCDRLCAFFRRGMTMQSGAAFTQAWASDRGTDTYQFVAKATA